MTALQLPVCTSSALHLFHPALSFPSSCSHQCVPSMSLFLSFQKHFLINVYHSCHLLRLPMPLCQVSEWDSLGRDSFWGPQVALPCRLAWDASAPCLSQRVISEALSLHPVHTGRAVNGAERGVVWPAGPPSSSGFGVSVLLVSSRLKGFPAHQV